MELLKLSLLAVAAANAFSPKGFAPYKRQIAPSGYVGNSVMDSANDKDLTSAASIPDKDKTASSSSAYSSVSASSAVTLEPSISQMITTSVVKIDVYPTISPSLVLSTSYVTVFHCPDSVTDCPLRSRASTTTSVIVLSTSLCPVTITSSSISHVVSSAPLSYMAPLPSATPSTPGSTVVVTHPTQSYTPGTASATTLPLAPTTTYPISSQPVSSSASVQPMTSFGSSQSITESSAVSSTTSSIRTIASTINPMSTAEISSAAINITSILPSASAETTVLSGSLVLSLTSNPTIILPTNAESSAVTMKSWSTSLTSQPTSSPETRGVPATARQNSTSFIPGIVSSATSYPSSPNPVSSSFLNGTVPSTSLFIPPGFVTVPSTASSATPVYGPSMLGGGYGGGFSPQPSVFVSPATNFSVNTGVPPGYGYTVSYFGSEAVTAPASIGPAPSSVAASYTVVYGGSATSVLPISPTLPSVTGSSGEQQSTPVNVLAPGQSPSVYTIVIPPGTTLTTAIPMPSLVPNIPTAGQSTLQNPGGPVYVTASTSTLVLTGQASFTSTTAITPAGATMSNGPVLVSYTITVGGTPTVVSTNVPVSNPPVAPESSVGSYGVVAGSITTEIPAFDTSSLASQLSKVTASAHGGLTPAASVASPGPGASSASLAGSAPLSSSNVAVSGSATSPMGPENPPVAANGMPTSEGVSPSLPTQSGGQPQGTTGTTGNGMSGPPLHSGSPAGNAPVVSGFSSNAPLSPTGAITGNAPAGAGGGASAPPVSPVALSSAGSLLQILPGASVSGLPSSAPLPLITLPTGVPPAPPGQDISIILPQYTTMVIPAGSYSTLVPGASVVGQVFPSGGPSLSPGNYGNGTAAAPMSTPTQYTGGARQAGAALLMMTIAFLSALLLL